MDMGRGLALHNAHARSRKLMQLLWEGHVTLDEQLVTHQQPCKNVYIHHGDRCRRKRRQDDSRAVSVYVLLRVPQGPQGAVVRALLLPRMLAEMQP